MIKLRLNLKPCSPPDITLHLVRGIKYWFNHWPSKLELLKVHFLLSPIWVPSVHGTLSSFIQLFIMFLISREPWPIIYFLVKGLQDIFASLEGFHTLYPLGHHQINFFSTVWTCISLRLPSQPWGRLRVAQPQEVQVPTHASIGKFELDWDHTCEI